MTLSAEACLRKQASWLLLSVVGGGVVSDRWLTDRELGVIWWRLSVIGNRFVCHACSPGGKHGLAAGTAMLFSGKSKSRYFKAFSEVDVA